MIKIRAEIIINKYQEWKMDITRDTQTLNE